MINYTTLLILVLFLCNTSNAQEYLLDSLSTTSTFYTSQGPNVTRGESKFKYDSEKRLVSRVNRSSHEIYTYSDEENTKETYFGASAEFGFREIDFLDEDGFITESVRYLNDNGDIKLMKKTNYYRSADDKVEKEVSEIYTNGSITHDYVFYKDSISYVYDGDELMECLKIRYDSEEVVKECFISRYTYFDDHVLEKVEIGEDNDCGSYSSYSETKSYYSDNEFFAFSSVVIHGFVDVGLWDLVSERTTEMSVDGDDIIVTYEENEYVNNSIERSGVLIYKKAELISSSNDIGFNVNVAMRPNISETNGLIRIDSEAKENLRIEIYSIQGVLIYSESIVKREGMELTAPNQKGTYFVKFSDESSKEFITKKLVVF